MENTENPESKFPDLTNMIVVGAVAGFTCGLFFGPYCGWLKWIGDAYVGLLQMSVLPFVTVSLVANFGRLSLKESGRLAVLGIRSQLLLWTIAIVALLCMCAAFPPWRGGTFFSSSLIEPPASPDWLAIFIPSNPFHSLAENLVPAVVVFSLTLGIALASVANKKAFLDQLDILVDGLSRLNKLVVRLSPLGVFAIVAHTSGTLSLHQFGLMQGYLLTYAVAAILLSFIVLPVIVTSVTPFTVSEIFRAVRHALLTAFTIGNTFVVLPLIIDGVKRLFETHRIEVDTDHPTPEFIVPLAYPFPDIGRIMGLIFIPFAAWFHGTTLDAANLPALLCVGLFGAFAKPVVMMPLMLRLAELPDDIFALYLAVGVIASRFGDIMKTMHLFTFTVLVSCGAARRLHVRVRRLLGGLSIAAVVGFLAILGIRAFLSTTFDDSLSGEEILAARTLQSPPVRTIVLSESEPNTVPLAAGQSLFDRLTQTKVLRVGFQRDRFPFSYLDRDQHLVGLDIDMACQLAYDLDVDLEFVPAGPDITEGLNADHFDVAVGGLEGTVARAMTLPHTEPYLEIRVGLAVLDHRRPEFHSLSTIEEAGDLRIAVVRESLASEFRQAGTDTYQFVLLESEREFFESRGKIADALVTSLEVGSAWTVLHPEYSVINVEGIDTRIPLYYYVALEDRGLEEFLEAWLTLKKNNGTVSRFYDYWILGKEERPRRTRWFVLRDVLGWVE